MHEDGTALIWIVPVVMLGRPVSDAEDDDDVEQTALQLRQDSDVSIEEKTCECCAPLNQASPRHQ